MIGTWSLKRYPESMELEYMYYEWFNNILLLNRKWRRRLRLKSPIEHLWPFYLSFSYFTYAPTSDPTFVTTDVSKQRCKLIHRISKVFGSRSGATEILRMISVQKCQFFLLISYIRKLTNVYARCSCKLIIIKEWLVYIHSLDFPLIIYVTKIGQFHIS